MHLADDSKVDKANRIDVLQQPRRAFSVVDAA
jgi:hypothetical protein